jgi:hypothetical protein
MDSNETKTPVVILVVAWLIVGVPAAWGVTQTINKSMALFQSSPAAAAAPATRPASP